MSNTHTICCLNPISKSGTDRLPEGYTLTKDLDSADAALVRSASMHELDLPESLLAIARAGAGVNNIPLDRCTEEGIVVFNTPGANANGVKELVLAGLLLGARDISGGIEWVRSNRDDANISKDMEKSKKSFAGTEIKGKTLGVIGLGAIGREVANAAIIEPTRTIIMTILPKLPKSPPKMSIPPAKKMPIMETRRAVLPEKALTSLSRAVFHGKSF